MIPALKILGIDAFAGQFLLFSDLKSAYRESRLRTHPDRKQGGHDDFILMQSAHEKLTNLIKASSGSLGLSVELQTYFSDLDEKIDALKTGFRDLRSDMAHQDKRLNQYGERVAHFSQQVDEHISYVAAHCEQYTQELHELTDEMDLLAVLLREKGYDVPPWECDESKDNTSQARNPNRLFSSSSVSVNPSASSASDEPILSTDEVWPEF